VKPKILGSANDLQEMSPIGKYLLNDGANLAQHGLPETPLDFITPYPNNQFVNNLISNTSNASIVNHGVSLQPK
jgi:hypothetical protein